MVKAKRKSARRRALRETLLAGAGHWYLGSVDWALLGNLLIGSIPGIILGSYLATRARDAVIRIALASVLVIVGVRLLG
ncbi:MAG TPA: sulfite exporter TauE/SafE family protein [Xanthobacteraceae bacterium]|jgi:hypothetical protein|nr:sulfite exporter TauE/SafE family protein [Xanthobacteraceae bacterium]